MDANGHVSVSATSPALGRGTGRAGATDLGAYGDSPEAALAR
jgi:hypothetical protein